MKVHTKRLRLLALPALLGLASLLSSGAADAAQAPDTMEQHWELTSETVANQALATSLTIPRGTIPHGATKFDPAPTVDFEVVGKVANGAGNGAWRVELKDIYSFTLATVEFPRTDTAFGIRHASFTWPSSDYDIGKIDLTPVAPTGSLAGTFDMQKAYLKIHQEGIIKKTVGRVPLGTKQLSVTSPSYIGLTDPSLYRYKTADFDPAPAIKLRASGKGQPCHFDVSLYDDTAAALVSGSELQFTSNAASYESDNLSLTNDHVYRVQIKLYTGCVAAGSSTRSPQSPNSGGTGGIPTGDFLSADLVFEQATADVKGITRTVGFYPGVTAAVDATNDAQVLNFGFRVPAATIPNTITGDLTYVAKRTTGTGNVRAHMLSGGAIIDTLATNQVSSGADFALANPNSVASFPNGSPADPELIVQSIASINGAGTTGRISSTLLRLVLDLRDVTAPVIGQVAWTNTAFSPVLPTSNPKSNTRLSFALSDYSSATFDVTLAGPTTLSVTGIAATGSGANKQGSWTWDGRKNGVVPDGVYTATITATDGAGNVSAPYSVSQSITVDTVAPTILNFSVATSPVTTPVRFSPNGDGYLDSVTYSAGFSEQSTWSNAISSGCCVGPLGTGSGTSMSYNWNGFGAGVTDGTYAGALTVTDLAGNSSSASSTLIRDTTGPTVANVAVSQIAFSPNGDGIKDSSTVTADLADAWAPTDYMVLIKRADDDFVARQQMGSVPSGWGQLQFVWSGTDDSGVAVPDGRYVAEIVATDAGRNSRTIVSQIIVVDRRPPDIRLFAPLEGSTVAVPQQPLIAEILEPASTVGLEQISFRLQDAGLGTTVQFAASSFADGLAKSLPRTLSAGHRYRVFVDVSDGAGNSRTYGSATSAPFLATESPQTGASAAIPATKCALANAVIGALTKTATCSDVPVALGTDWVELSAVNRDGSGVVKHVASLSTAEIYTDLGAGNTLAIQPPPGLPGWEPRTIVRPFSMRESTSVQRAVLPAAYTDIGNLQIEVPVAWQNTSIRMTSTVGSASVMVCGDPYLASAFCAPDPVPGEYLSGDLLYASAPHYAPCDAVLTHKQKTVIVPGVNHTVSFGISSDFSANSMVLRYQVNGGPIHEQIGTTLVGTPTFTIPGSELANGNILDYQVTAGGSNTRFNCSLWGNALSPAHGVYHVAVTSNTQDPADEDFVRESAIGAMWIAQLQRPNEVAHSDADAQQTCVTFFAAPTPCDLLGGRLETPDPLPSAQTRVRPPSNVQETCTDHVMNFWIAHDSENSSGGPLGNAHTARDNNALLVNNTVKQKTYAYAFVGANKNATGASGIGVAFKVQDQTVVTSTINVKARGYSYLSGVGAGSVRQPPITISLGDFVTWGSARVDAPIVYGVIARVHLATENNVAYWVEDGRLAQSVIFQGSPLTSRVPGWLPVIPIAYRYKPVLQNWIETPYKMPNVTAYPGQTYAWFAELATGAHASALGANESGAVSNFLHNVGSDTDEVSGLSGMTVPTIRTSGGFLCV